MSKGLLVGAARFELATPSPPEYGSWFAFGCGHNHLARLASLVSGLISGPGDSFQRRSYFAVEDVRIARRGLQVGMVERPLDQLEIASVAKKLRPQAIFARVNSFLSGSIVERLTVALETRGQSS